MKRHSLKGFTLMELLVVLALIGILSALLVPNILSFIKDSRYRDANSMARMIYSAAATYCVEYKISDTACSIDLVGNEAYVTKFKPYLEEAKASDGLYYLQFNIKPFKEASNKTITVTSINMAVEKYMADRSNTDVTGSRVIVAVKSNDTIDRVFWAQDVKSKYVGAYPDPVDSDAPIYDKIADVLPG